MQVTLTQTLVAARCRRPRLGVARLPHPLEPLGGPHAGAGERRDVGVLRDSSLMIHCVYHRYIEIMLKRLGNMSPIVSSLTQLLHKTYIAKWAWNSDKVVLV